MGLGALWVNLLTNKKLCLVLWLNFNILLRGTVYCYWVSYYVVRYIVIGSRTLTEIFIVLIDPQLIKELLVIIVVNQIDCVKDKCSYVVMEKKYVKLLLEKKRLN